MGVLCDQSEEARVAVVEPDLKRRRIVVPFDEPQAIAKGVERGREVEGVEVADPAPRADQDPFDG